MDTEMESVGGAEGHVLLLCRVSPTNAELQRLLPWLLCVGEDYMCVSSWRVCACVYL